MLPSLKSDALPRSTRNDLAILELDSDSTLLPTMSDPNADIIVANATGGRDPTRVLSIQSHVVSGYVGNRAATFPLQLLGYDVDVINTVQFSNHTGYGHTNGHKTNPTELTNVFEGLRTNGLLGHGRVLTGYIPGAEALQVVGQEVERMRQEGEGGGDWVYVLDPVMGDIGKGLYVAEDVIPIYKNLLRSATIITPNQFETELLSGIPIHNLPTLHESLSSLHQSHSLQHIALSSIPLPVSLLAPLDLPAPPASYTRLLPNPLPPWYEAVGSPSSSSEEQEVLVCFASSTSAEGELETYAFALPSVQGYFSGVGDLFSAMVLAHYDPHRSTQADGLSPLAHAVSLALLTVQQVLLRTHLHSIEVSTASSIHGAATPRPTRKTYIDSLPSDAELDAAEPVNPKDPKRKAKRMRLRELRVVQERALIVDGGEGWPGKRIDWRRVLAAGGQ